MLTSTFSPRGLPWKGIELCRALRWNTYDKMIGECIDNSSITGEGHKCKHNVLFYESSWCLRESCLSISMLLGLTRGYDMTFQQYNQCSRNALVRLEQWSDPLDAMQPSHPCFLVVTEYKYIKAINFSFPTRSSSPVPASIHIYYRGGSHNKL